MCTHYKQSGQNSKATIGWSWKDINEGWLNSAVNDIPRPLFLRIVNLARVNEVIYRFEDGFTHAEVVLKDIIASLLAHRTCSYTTSPLKLFQRQLRSASAYGLLDYQCVHI